VSRAGQAAGLPGWGCPLQPAGGALPTDFSHLPASPPASSHLLQRFYSGRKKRHFRNNLVWVDWRGGIRDVMPGFDGREHDSTVCRLTEWHTQRERFFDDAQTCMADCGFQGCDLVTPAPVSAAHTPNMERYNKTLRCVGSRARGRCLSMHACSLQRVHSNARPSLVPPPRPPSLRAPFAEPLAWWWSLPLDPSRGTGTSFRIKVGGCRWAETSRGGLRSRCGAHRARARHRPPAMRPFDAACPHAAFLPSHPPLQPA
jgi:hypothetical protein